MTVAAWECAYEARFEKSQFGDDAIGLFALGLKLGIDDMEAVGTEIITGGGDDKKCDLVYLDKEEGRCVIAQCYVSRKPRPGTVQQSLRLEYCNYLASNNANRTLARTTKIERGGTPRNNKNGQITRIERLVRP